MQTTRPINTTSTVLVRGFCTDDKPHSSSHLRPHLLQESSLPTSHSWTSPAPPYVSLTQCSSSIPRWQARATYCFSCEPSGVGHHCMAQTGPPAKSAMSQRSGWGGVDSNLLVKTQPPVRRMLVGSTRPPGGSKEHCATHLRSLCRGSSSLMPHRDTLKATDCSS